MNYYNTHLRKTTDPTKVRIGQLERGMVVKMKYQKADSSIGIYMVLILQPRWPNTVEGKLHVLSLNNIGTGKVKEFGDRYNEIISESTRIKKLDLAKLQIDKSSKLFYTSEIKKEKVYRQAYRTFNLNQIETMHAVNYDWGRYDKIPSATERARLDEESKNEESKNK